MRNRTTTLRAAIAAAVVAGAVAALWLAPLGNAIDEVNDRPAPLGIVGMNGGETLHLSVAYVKGFDPQPDPPGCQLAVGFADEDGVTVGNPNIVELRPGAVAVVRSRRDRRPEHPPVRAPDRQRRDPAGASARQS